MFEHNKKQIISWALYDWANSAYAVTVMTVFFPIFLKDYWGSGVEATQSTFELGMANSLSGLLVVLLAPVLGAIADSANARKKFLMFFATMGIVMTACLTMVEKGNLLMAVAVYIMATLGFMGANVFSDSLITIVVGEKKRDVVSSLGYALGYLGGGLLFTVTVAMTLTPETFGLANKVEAVRISFVCVALWWAVFSIPLVLFVKEPEKQTSMPVFTAVAQGLKQIKSTFIEIKKLRVVFLFLMAYWLYIDGVDTVVRMAVDYGMALGFDTTNLIIAILITQFVGFPATIAFGFLGEKFGTKKSIMAGICVYIVIVVWAYFMDNVKEFYMLAITVGLVQGGVQSLSRSFFSRLIPKEKSAEFFGFYNMWGKFAAIIGPILMGWVGVLTGSTRVSILSIALLLIFGAVLLYFVDEAKGREVAKTL